MHSVLQCSLVFILILIWTCCTNAKSVHDPQNHNDINSSCKQEVPTNSAIMSSHPWPEKDQNQNAQAGSASLPQAGLGSERNLLGAAVLLYLQCEVSGQPVKAFVDTGAQATVMSEACAKRCGLLGRIDTKFAGRAVGVGSARILGRIHSATLRIGTLKVRCEINILQNADMDLLIGLDVLRAYKCEIDLRRNNIRFNFGKGKYEDVSFTSPKVLLDQRANSAENGGTFASYGDDNGNSSNDSPDISLSGW
mmetsp:Transcript_4333/g.5977  ORF Transcript_4333/g.5977 Transcript_4333/m.5977 type:complete len:251 (+) Transcript_4333:94-846(+)